MKKAFITGVTGQDGSYLAEFLLEKNYQVHALNRRSATSNTSNIDHIKNDIIFYNGDLTERAGLFSLLQKIVPNEIYNLGAQSDVKASFSMPEYTSNVNAMGTLALLESIKCLKPHYGIKFYQASTSEMFGNISESPQTEQTRFYPRSPYGISKLFAYWMVINYREAYNIHASNGILFNHESPRRGDNFVTQKIVKTLSSVLRGKIPYLQIGNLEARRDWGHAKDYVEGMWLMLQQNIADDYILATGETHSVREFIEAALKEMGISTIVWEGTKEKEVGYISDLPHPIVVVNPKYYRPTEVEFLCGDSNKARSILGWEPKYSFEDLVKDMVDNV
jgi:GDPmannose 4,6-dehydratase